MINTNYNKIVRSTEKELRKGLGITSSIRIGSINKTDKKNKDKGGETSPNLKSILKEIMHMFKFIILSIIALPVIFLIFYVILNLIN